MADYGRAPLEAALRQLDAAAAAVRDGDTVRALHAIAKAGLLILAALEEL